MKPTSINQNQLGRAKPEAKLALPTTRADQQAGLTLIECLVAIVILAIVGAIIAPAMVISVATRVQSQKAAQALDIAQSEIDRVRLLVERGDDYVSQLPPQLPDSEIDALNNELELAQVDGPNQAGLFDFAAWQDGSVNWDTFTQSFAVDIDDDGSPDFAVQSFRTPGQTVDGTDATDPVAFIVGVRVYEHRAVDNASGNLSANPQASLTMTSGEGNRLELPLATLYSSIALSEDAQAFCSYIDYLSTTSGNATDKPLGCD
jgi:prepilin-type N-terminal cleavage/methylation domain-containing protein